MDKKTKPHAVCVPLPVQGHINAMLHLAKLLHSKGFFITFVISEFNHKRILRNKGLSSLDSYADDFRFATIPDGLQPSDDVDNRGQDIPSLCASTQRNCSKPFRELLMVTLSDPLSSVPPVSCVISDFVTSFTLTTTAEMGIPNVFFVSVSACGFTSFFYMKELRDRGIIPLKSEEDLTNGYLDTVIDWIPGLIKLPLKDLTSFVRTTNPDDILPNFILDETQASLRASALIFNTFHELEGPVIDALSSILPPIYEIGPLSLLSQHILAQPSSSINRLSLWSEDSSCIKWLDEEQPGSVVYVNFGSITVITNEELEEFAWGLADSGYAFLWVIRPDLVVGDCAVLPEEFGARTKERGFLTSWCAQGEVLSHPAIGGFLTHCGWNSTTESISAGVPMMCWPFFADQQINCKYMCSEWGIGMEINEGVKREAVAGLIKELMEGPKGKLMKSKASEWKEKANRAALLGGDSWTNLDRIIQEIIMK